ncbi:hypothetical protein N5923_00170 [Erwiniaceae bacterium BAC15a-03b]|uniref:Uncharacterized protein n=1 Tax=Winslowiella arboricola TaxID=2978220 RepID=A0A9J6PHI3_9GAMM|nr:hypothetical protein [Winslowiella arboricola]MCU5771613.1 hypothetical protein [Winslowiella arboricola]MCU5775915.1 hypothetical protein [Winslowiella arboricola]
MRNGNLPLQPQASDLLLHTEDAISWPEKKRMISATTSRERKRFILLEELYYALHRRCHQQPPPEFNEWVSTRVLAEDCDMGIYQTRSLLLKLVDQKRVIVAPTPISNSLRWYIAHNETAPSPAGE